MLVEPARRHRPVAERRIGHQLEQQRAVGEPGVEHDDGVAQRGFQPRQRRRACRAVGNDFGQHRVEDGRHHVVLHVAGIDAHAGPERCLEVDEPARTRREALVGVFGIQARLDGGAAWRGRLVGGQPRAAADIDLQADEVDAEDLFRHRVLDLQPRVHLQEIEGLQIGQQQELGRACADVAGDARQVRPGFAQRALDLGDEPGRRRLFQHLLLPALHRAVARAQRPHAAMAVGQHLHLDVAGIGDEGLDEDRGVAEGGAGLGRGRAVGADEFIRVVHAPDAAPAAAGSGLEQHRKADARCAGRRTRFIDRLARPRADRHAGLLGQALGRDLVAKGAHGAGRRAQEDHAVGFASLLQLGPLGRKAPARPQCVGTGLLGEPHDALDIEVGAAQLAAVVIFVAHHRIAQAHRAGGHAHEGRVGVGMRVQRDDRQRDAVLTRPAARGPHEAHCGLAAVGHRDT